MILYVDKNEREFNPVLKDLHGQKCYVMNVDANYDFEAGAEISITLRPSGKRITNYIDLFIDNV